MQGRTLTGTVLALRRCIARLRREVRTGCILAPVPDVPLNLQHDAAFDCAAPWSFRSRRHRAIA